MSYITCEIASCDRCGPVLARTLQLASKRAMSSLRVKLPAFIHPPLDINTLERIEGDITNAISHLRRSNAELQAALDEGDDSDFKAALVSGGVLRSSVLR